MFHTVLTGWFVVFVRVRWLNGSLVVLEPGAGLFMAGVTCVTLMSWTTNSCHASAKATRSVHKLLFCLKHAFLICVCLLEHNIMAVYIICLTLTVCASLHISPCKLDSGFIQVYELFPITAADGGCQKCGIFRRIPTGCFDRPDNIWRGCSCCGTRALVNHAAGSVCHGVQVQININVYLLFFKHLQFDKYNQTCLLVLCYINPKHSFKQ